MKNLILLLLLTTNICLAEGVTIIANKKEIINGDDNIITATVNSDKKIQFVAINKGGADIIDTEPPYQWVIPPAKNKDWIGYTKYKSYAVTTDDNIIIGSELKILTKNPMSFDKITFSGNGDLFININSNKKFSIIGIIGDKKVSLDADGTGVTYKTKEINSDNPSPFITVSNLGIVTGIKEGRSYLIAMKDGLEAKKIIEVKDYIKELAKYENPEKLSSSGGGSLNLFFLIFLSILSLIGLFSKKQRTS